MAYTNQNFEVFQGDDKEVTFIVYDENGSLLPLTDYELKWVMYSKAGDVVITKTDADGLAVGFPVSQAVLTLVPSDTINIDEGFYNHELEVTAPTGEVSTVTTGLVKVSYSKA